MTVKASHAHSRDARAPYRPVHAARTLPSEAAETASPPRSAAHRLSKQDRRHVIVVLVATVATAVAFGVYGGADPPAGHGPGTTSAAVASCENQVRSGLRHPDAVRFSAESWSTRADGTVQVRGEVAAVDPSGSAVSGPWTCTAEPAGGSWSASVSLDPALA